MIRVAVVDDHALVRTGIVMLLSQQTDMDCVGEAGSGEEALDLARRAKPDVVLCDLHLPGVSGLGLIERLLNLRPAPRVVVVSMQEEGPLPRRALEAGASGYVTKGGPAEELLRAIRDASRGKRYIGAELARSLALGGLGGDASPFDALSPRELEIAMLLVQGLRMTEIAERLILSPKTVSTHKYRLLEKLGIDDVVSLARLASQYGLSDPTRGVG
ncbi:MAG: response regulator transcription factor [Lysobacteraceae bacterium]